MKEQNKLIRTTGFGLNDFIPHLDDKISKKIFSESILVKLVFNYSKLL